MYMVVKGLETVVTSQSAVMVAPWGGIVTCHVHHPAILDWIYSNVLRVFGTAPVMRYLPYGISKMDRTV
jgi:hypothetical protein